MGFILGVIQAFLNALGNIFWKKSIHLANISKGLFILYAKLVGLLFVISFSIFGLINYKILIDWKAILGMIIVVSLWLITAFIKQGLLKFNKVSSILPFENLAPLFTILMWYFLFHDSSVASFLVSILTIFVVIIFSFDYKKFTFPKKVSLLIFQQFLFALSTIVMAFVLKKYNWPSVALLDVILSILILIIFTIKFSELKQFHKQKLDFYKYRFWAGFAGRTAYVISLFLISDLWVVISTLLTFLTLGFILIMGYFYLDDKPSKKDIILAIIVTCLVWLWIYFK